MPETSPVGVGEGAWRGPAAFHSNGSEALLFGEQHHRVTQVQLGVALGKVMARISPVGSERPDSPTSSVDASGARQRWRAAKPWAALGGDFRCRLGGRLFVPALPFHGGEVEGEREREAGEEAA